ncbi:MAG: ribokinase [Actinomycetales bacterium]|nr:ribokinase [Actinomycetales bacterium]
MARIVVLGSANLDLVVRQARLPAPGETIAGSEFTTVPGGKGLNQAVAAARAGADVAFLGAIGPDDVGARLRAQLEADGIDTAGLREVDVATGTAHIAVLDDGENAIVVVPGANADVTLTDADRSAICAADALVLQLERPLELVAAALAEARAAGVATVLTPAPVQALPDDLLALVDVLVPNEHEAVQLARVGDPEEAARVLSARGPRVLVTRGARGVLVAEGGAIVTSSPAFAADPVDTTAAGDTFVGGYVATRAEAGEAEAIRFGQAAAAIGVTRAGASSSMPTRAEVDAFLASRATG